MKKMIFSVTAAIVGALLVPTNAVADPYGGLNVLHYLSLVDDQGNQFNLVGTSDQIEDRIEELQSEAITLSAAVTLGDNCRIQACYKTVVDVSTGKTQYLPLSESEILQREVDTAKRAARAQALVDSAGSNYQIRQEAVFAIPIATANSSQTIQGTPSQIAEQVKQLRAQADALKSDGDPCAVSTCYKTNVDLHWGNSPATTSTIPLTAEDLAQRAVDRQNQAAKAEAVAKAAEAGLVNGPAPVYSLSINLPNQGFGTSGTRDQLATVVADLQARAAQAAESAANLANNPIVERNMIVDLHWGLAPATTTIEEKTLTGAERDARIAQANDQATRAQELAAAAAQQLAQIP